MIPSHPKEILNFIMVYTYSKNYDYVPLPLPSCDRPVTVLGPTLPTVTVFGPKSHNVTQRDINVTDRYWPLPIVTEFYRYLRYKRYRS